MQKKIGILTFHRAHNYGAVLQAYALQTYLTNLGHKVEIIDYRPEYIEEVYRLTPKFSIKSSKAKYPTILRILKYLLWRTVPIHIMAKIRRRKYFNSFINNQLNCSKKVYLEPFDKNLDYDIYLLGSDQIWNPGITKGIDCVFWGSFHISDNAKIATYAASSSYYDFSEEECSRISGYLQNMTNISVREDRLKYYLSSKFNIEASQVLDPTLLVDRKIWDDIAVKPSFDKYVVAYFSDDNTMKAAKAIAEKRGLKVIGIKLGYIGELCNQDKQTFRVEEFVGLFKYADCIVSSSFHGMVFSIIFNREFYMLKGFSEGRDTRLTSILNKLNITGRFISDIENDVERANKIDYSIVNNKLEQLRVESKEYLHTIMTE